MKNPSVESVAGEHTQLFTEGFPIIFHDRPFSSWKKLIFLLILCADFELGAQCLPVGGLWLPGDGLKGTIEKIAASFSQCWLLKVQETTSTIVNIPEFLSP